MVKLEQSKTKQKKHHKQENGERRHNIKQRVFFFNLASKLALKSQL
jgi:hypothetical protein